MENNQYWNSYSILNENKKLNIKEKLKNDIFIDKIYKEYEILSELLFCSLIGPTSLEVGGSDSFTSVSQSVR